MIIRLVSNKDHNYGVVETGSLFQNMRAALRSVHRTHPDGELWTFQADREALLAIDREFNEMGLVTMEIPFSSTWVGERKFLNIPISEIEG